MSQDAVSVTTLVAACGMLWIMSGVIVEEISDFMIYCFEATSLSDWRVSGNLQELESQGLMALVRTVLPLLLTTAVCAVAATFLQTRFLVSWELLRPKFSKINPLQGIKRLFSLKSVIDTLKGLLKITILLIIIYRNLKGLFLESTRYLYTDINAACAHLFGACGRMVIQIVVAFIALAAFDYLYQWWEYERNLRMSKQEIKEEYKQIEGDPQVKGKIKEMQRQRAQTRMMQQVPQADVVIKNPTHFAVALQYRPEQDNAPIVLAKGQDELALRIIRTAEEHQISVIENIPLARALYANTELNREIPAEFYGAVAEVLVYIFKLNEKHQIVK